MPRNRFRNKEQRTLRAKERLEETANRTPQDQLKRLDTMFGEGLGAAKERAKLVKRIEERNRLKKEAAKKVADVKSKSEAKRLKIQTGEEKKDK